MPPLIGTTGAASARGFGLFGASAAAPGYFAVTTSPSNNYANGLATDSGNNSIIVGPNTGSGNLIMKVSPFGIIVWAKRFGSTGSGQFKAVVCDSSDNIYAVGNTVSQNAIIVKFDSSGNILWQRQQNPGITGTGSYQREMIWESVKIMPNGNVVVGGTYRDYNQVFTCCGPVAVAVNYFAIAVYNSSGTLQWRTRYGSSSPATFPNVSWSGNSVGVDSSNNIYITGVAPPIVSAGTVGIPIIKYDSTGTFQWGYIYRNTASTTCNGGTLAVGASGVYATSFGNINSNFLFKVDSSGTFQWGRRMQSAGNEQWESFLDSALDSTESFYGTGKVRYYTGAQEYDYATVKLDSSGGTQWLRSAGRPSSSSDDEAATTIAISADNYYCLGGEGFGSITTEMFCRLKTDGSQTGTYVIGGGTATIQYQPMFSVTVVAETPTRTLSSSTWPVSSTNSSLTYTETTPTNTVSNSGATIQTRTI